MNDVLDGLFGVINNGIGAYKDIKVSSDAVKHAQYGQNGMYTNGMANGAGLAISPMVLLIGAAVLVVVFMKD